MCFVKLNVYDKIEKVIVKTIEIVCKFQTNRKKWSRNKNNKQIQTTYKVRSNHPTKNTAQGKEKKRVLYTPIRLRGKKERT